MIRRIIWFQALSAVAITLAGMADRGLIPGFPFQLFTPIVLTSLIMAFLLPPVVIILVIRWNVPSWQVVCIPIVSIVLAWMTITAFMPLIQ